MRKIIKLMCVSGLISMLVGCEDQNNYQYLITHPKVMKKKMEACTNMSATASNLEKQRCEIVTNASTKFMAVVAEQQIDAEKFGVKVLAAQTDYANLKVKVKKLDADLTNAKATNADAATIHKLEAELATAKKDCEVKRQEVRMMLAVMGVSSPN